MVDAWSIVVTREPEWDDYTRSRVLALMAWESKQCPNCKNYDSLVPLPLERRHVTWPQHGNQVWDVVQYRCMACGAADIIRRDFMELHKDDKPVRGQFNEADGRMFIARPPDPEEA